MDRLPITVKFCFLIFKLQYFDVLIGITSNMNKENIRAWKE